MHLATFIQLCVYVMGYLPYTIYLLYTLWKYRENSYFAKRNPKLLLGIITFTCLIYSNNVLLWHGSERQLCIIPVCKTVSHGILDVITMSFLYGLYLTFTVRVWLLYFNLRWSEEIKRSEWSKEINIESTKNNFFLKYKPTALGSFAKMKWYILMTYAILVSVFSIIAFYNIALFEEVNGVSIFLVFVFQMVILCVTPNDDVFYIRKEMIISSIVWFMIAAYYGITIPFKFHDKYVIVAIMTPYVTFVASSLINGVTILCPLYHLQSMKITEVLHLSSASDQKILWTEYVRRSRTNFDNFMDHLVKEYAVENLLFILEVMQFKSKNFDTATLHSAIENEDSEVGYYLPLPSGITRSSIIYGKETIHPLQQILSLYNKYIVRGAPLQVNLSWNVSQNIDTVINSVIMNRNSLQFNALIFDDAVKDTVGLINDSWRRYKSSATSKPVIPVAHIIIPSSHTSTPKETVTTPSTMDNSTEMYC